MVINQASVSSVPQNLNQMNGARDVRVAWSQTIHRASAEPLPTSEPLAKVRWATWPSSAAGQGTRESSRRTVGALHQVITPDKNTCQVRDVVLNVKTQRMRSEGLVHLVSTADPDSRASLSEVALLLLNSIQWQLMHTKCLPRGSIVQRRLYANHSEQTHNLNFYIQRLQEIKKRLSSGLTSPVMHWLINQRRKVEEIQSRASVRG